LPTYEYVCRSCDAHLEVVQRFDDASLTECPSCGGALRKAFGNIGIVFKGSGFYKNDSRSVAKSGNGNGSKAGEDAKESAKGSDTGGGKEAGSGSKEGTTTTTKEAAPAAKESTGSKPSSGSSSAATPSTKSA
jgi:putative FmdB family regulatory protein